jgi:hypothetical protein
MDDVRAYTNESRALIASDGYVYDGTLWPTEERTAEREREWQACKSPHVTPDHEAGPLTFGGDQDWDRTVVKDIQVKGTRAVVLTEELPQGPELASVGAETYRYVLHFVGGEWRIHARHLLNAFPPPKWTRYLL